MNTYLFFPSRKAFITAEEKGNIIPEDFIQDLYDSFEGTSIDPIQKEQNVDTSVDLNQVSSRSDNESFISPPPVAPATPVKNNQVSTVARDMNTRLATLLNPNDRIIAQRQGRTV